MTIMKTNVKGAASNMASKVNASLYNGHPNDSGQSSHSAGLTSSMSSISNFEDGVSVGNALMSNKQWFVLRVSYGRTIKAKAYIEAKGMVCYVPMRYKQLNKVDKNRFIKEPLLSSFIFVYAYHNQVDELLHDSSINLHERKALLSYYYDHTTFRKDAPSKNPPLTISDYAMENFIKLTSINNPHVIPVISEKVKYKLGDEVIISEGEFEGIRGRVVRIAGQQRGVVELVEDCLVATAYIPKEAMQLILQNKVTYHGL